MAEPLVSPELLDPVVAYFWPRRVILFGYFARGDAGPGSDIDLLAVLDDDAAAEKLTYRAGMEARRPYQQPTDVIACREDTYRRFSKIVGTLPCAALRLVRYSGDLNSVQPGTSSDRMVLF